MIELNLSKLTNVQLADLITKAANIISTRALEQKTIYLEQPAPVVRVVNTPSSRDMHIVQVILKKVKDGVVVKASEKDEYAKIVSEFAGWADSKKYPDSLRGASERRFKEYGRV